MCHRAEFDRRTYMIVAPGWSALAFNAAMSASSASTTIRSAFPFTLSPTVNCQDILAFLKLSYERALTGIERYLACELDLFVLGGCRVALSAHPHICTKIESGADAGLRGITCYWSAPRALHILALVNNGALLLQMAIQSHQTSDLEQGQAQILKPDCLGRAATD